jgi:uncharacterized phage protein (predicted DNA packaging)
MNIITLDEARSYLRLDELDEEDVLIEELVETAEEYVKSATGFTFESKVPYRAKLIVKLLISHWYDNRAIITTTPNVNKIPVSAETLLTQLTYSHVEDEAL